MARRTAIAFLIALIVTISAHADLRFSIRYHDKNIYYPGDSVKLKLTLANPEDSGVDDMTFHISDDPLESFGFDLRSLTGEPMPPAEGYAGALNDKDAYRVIHLARGQELSVTVDLNRWVDLSSADQYRLTGYFFPERRNQDSPAIIAVSVLDLTMMPDTRPRWEEELSEEVRSALIRRDLDPAGVVRETLENRRLLRFNRAAIYLDTEALARTSPGSSDAEIIAKSLREGSWENTPGLEHPTTSTTFVSSRVYPNEATVRLLASYNPYGESFTRDLRFYLHRDNGYWSIRRVEAIANGDADPLEYGSNDLSPPDVISEMLKAVKRGDWDVVLRYYDVEDIVKSLPEYRDEWSGMSASEHRVAIDDYRSKLISGNLREERKPLRDIDDWSISRVNYTDAEGNVIVENMTSFDTANGLMSQKTTYTFRLLKNFGNNENWRVIRYDTAVVR